MVPLGRLEAMESDRKPSPGFPKPHEVEGCCGLKSALFRSRLNRPPSTHVRGNVWGKLFHSIC